MKNLYSFIIEHLFSQTWNTKKKCISKKSSTTNL